MPKIKYIHKTHNSGGNKHPGIYGGKKDRAPTPKKTLIQISIPFEIAQQIQEMYPDVSLRIATQNYLTKILSRI